MGWENNTANQGRSAFPFKHTELALAAVTNFSFGPSGDIDPGNGGGGGEVGNAIGSYSIENKSMVATIRVANAVADLTTGVNYIDIEPGGVIEETVETPILAIRNLHGAQTADFAVVASLMKKANVAL